MSLMDYMVAFIEEYNLMRRESGKGLYTISFYYFAYMIHLVHFIIIYLMLGLISGFNHFFCLWGCLVLISLVSQVIYYNIATISTNVILAQIIAPIVVIILMIFTWFFCSKNKYLWFLVMGILSLVYQI